MPTIVYGSLTEFIERLGELSQSHEETRVAVDYLPSHLFTRDALERFCVSEVGAAGAAAAANLWRRARMLRRKIGSTNYRELVELNALDRVCETGAVHEAVYSYRATPSEIIGALRNALALGERFPHYAIAFCEERLPFVFTLDGMRSLLIDVQHNRGYQRIQGLELLDDDAILHFRDDFERIWQAQRTVSEPAAVCELLEERIAGL